MLQVQCITTPTDFAALRTDWDRLSSEVPFRRFAWHAAWWRSYGENTARQLTVLVVRNAEQKVVAIAPWFLEVGGTRGRVLRFLGSGEVCSDYQSLLVEPEYLDVATDVLAQWLSEAAVGQKEKADEPSAVWDLLELDGVDEADLPISRLVNHLWTRGNTLHREAGMNCWRLALPSSWVEYEAELSKSHRKQVRRFERRYLETGEAVLHRVTTPQELSQAMTILMDLHQRRRQSLGEPGCFKSEAFTKFLHEVAREFLAGGDLRLSWIELRGKPAAIEFQLAGGGITYAYQAGVEPDLLDDEPGRIINIATLKMALAAQQHAFDFLRGDEPYKAHWRAEPRPSIVYRVVPKRTLSQLRHGVWLAGDSLKTWVKTGLELAGMK